MEKPDENFKDELDDLKQELEHFQQEKERVRAIVGKIGGVPEFHTKLINTLFAIVIAVSMTISVIGDEKVRSLMVELALGTLSVKILYMIHCQMRVNHFKLWMLSSLEWRLNEMMRLIRQLEK